MFCVGDTVLYGSQGVCKIIGKDKREFAEHDREYLILQPFYDKNSSILVPSENQELISKIKPVLSAEEIKEVIQSMPEEDTIWIEDENLRKQKYQDIIHEADRKKLIQLIKTLYLHQISQKKKGRKLHQCDENFLKQAEKILYSEFAVVLQIKPEEVSDFIQKELETA